MPSESDTDSGRAPMGPGFVLPDPMHDGKYALVIYDIATDVFLVFRAATKEESPPLPKEVSDAS